MSESPVLQVAIIGAGFAGVGLAIQLQKAGIHRYRIFEKAERLGGVWRDNTYPGAACDVPAHLYCYSFEPKADWSRKFAPQAEILAYLEQCVERHQINHQIEFGCEILEASYDQKRRIWQLTTSDQRTIEAQAVVTACGQLNRPSIPTFKGLDQYQGRHFHSARWDHEFDFTGKRVAVIGNAASAIQFIPILADQASHLSIFQRSPNWILPKKDFAYSAITKALFKRLVGFRKLYRWMIYWIYESRLTALKKNSLLGKLLKWRTFRQTNRMIDQLSLDPTLLPDYAIGCKRILTSSDYYQTLSRENVQLHIAKIDRFSEAGIITDDEKHHSFDAVIFATGFEATAFLRPIQITGLNNQILEEQWSDGAEAYLGISTPNFPNLFMLYGPNTNLGHNSIIFMLECQFDYVIRCLKEAAGEQKLPIAVNRNVMKQFSINIQKALTRSVWDSGCGSWYKTSGGKIVNNWPYQTVTYWWKSRRSKLEEFDRIP